MPLTVAYFAGHSNGLGAFGETSLYLASTLRFPPADLTSANPSTVVTLMPPQGQREDFVLFRRAGAGRVRPRNTRVNPTAFAAAEVIKGIPLDVANPVVELQVSEGWVLDLVATE